MTTDLRVCTVVVILLFLSSSSGCNNSNRGTETVQVGTESSATLSNVVASKLNGELLFDVVVEHGTIRDSFGLEINCPLVHANTVSQINTSCGCTTTNIVQGQEITADTKIAVTINVAAGSFGAAQQAVFFQFTDGNTGKVTIRYSVLPPPHCEPKNLIITAKERAKKITVFFPSESKVNLQIANVPVGLRFSQSDGSRPGEYEISFDLVDFPEDAKRQGVFAITSETPSSEVIRLPYLVLDH